MCSAIRRIYECIGLLHVRRSFGFFGVWSFNRVYRENQCVVRPRRSRPSELVLLRSRLKSLSVFGRSIFGAPVCAGVRWTISTPIFVALLGTFQTRNRHSEIADLACVVRMAVHMRSTEMFRPCVSDVNVEFTMCDGSPLSERE